jgi:hypothetical protein
MNRFLKIFGVVLVCLIIILIIQKIFFKAPSTDKELLLFAREMNKTCPSMVDPETRLDKVIIFAGTNLQFYYTLVHMLKDSLPVTRLKT